MEPFKIQRNFLLISAVDENSREFTLCLKEIEFLLADNTYCHHRIAWLISLDDFTSKLTGIRNTKIKNPLNKKELNAVVSKGIVKAFKEGDVKGTKLLKLAHSVDGIRKLNDTLVSTEKKQMAKCWRKSV